jgi:hypothetical protein
MTMATKKLPEQPVEDLVDEVFAPKPRSLVESAPAKPAIAPVEATPTPEHVPSPVELKIWLLTCGKPADQTAGFRWWAEKRRLSSRTAPEWEQAWREFQNRPV